METKKRTPSEDQLIILRGFVGSYPNLFFKVNDKNLVDFIKKISASGTEQGLSELMNKYAVRRSRPDFRVFSDRVYRGYENFEPVDFGLLDYNRLENR